MTAVGTLADIPFALERTFRALEIKMPPREAVRRPPAQGPFVTEPSHAVFLSYASAGRAGCSRCMAPAFT